MLLTCLHFPMETFDLFIQANILMHGLVDGLLQRLPIHTRTRITE